MYPHDITILPGVQSPSLMVNSASQAPLRPRVPDPHPSPNSRGVAAPRGCAASAPRIETTREWRRYVFLLTIIIHFNMTCHYKPSSYWGIPIYGNLHMCIWTTAEQQTEWKSWSNLKPSELWDEINNHIETGLPTYTNIHSNETVESLVPCLTTA